VASDFVRQISSPFTTRLALVFASWADENIIRIETVQDAFVAFLQRIFFLLTSNKLLNKCLKYLKRLEVLLGTFRESDGIEQWPPRNRPPFYRGGSIDSGQILPSIYKRNLREEKYVENISRTRSERN